MKFDIFFDLKGAAGTVEQVPNTANPVECANLASLLDMLKSNLPGGPGSLIECVGIRIKNLDRG